ncbi:peptidoglycan-binding protein [Mycetocola lacteus]|uniref:Peptidoglycan-binding protein n=1 Tax=Mycetocola lacteus TaxID=76637 RepID=A0A3L7AKG8_9MICO|nr:peptidoglycan-binding domain-containing protein [Mycetocola lacteus]RLP80757.1 peptidoglycan-binding protein [Mycetocola lacteus]RLP84542.1 peptidoglycan-binding protein [Mycetocola lacteus]
MKIRSLILPVVAALIIGAATTWGAVTVLRPTEAAPTSTEFTTVKVLRGEVGSELSLNTVAEWPPIPVGTNRAEGVVTGITVSSGDEVGQGAALYTVNLRPVIIARGEVPAFRAIEAGVTGPDVAQLQQMLTDLKFYRGAIDGSAASGTIAAIRAWQKSNSLEQTGSISAADLIFVPALPARVSLDTALVYRGATLTGGEAVLSGLPAAPTFSIPVTEAQSTQIPGGIAVNITSPDGGMWTGITGAQERDSESATVTVAILGDNGESVCGDGCGQIPANGQSRFPSRIVTVEKVSGLVIPSAALITGADGSPAVVLETGKRVAVTVLASARGMSVVEGVDEGFLVRIPGKRSGQ